MRKEKERNEEMVPRGEMRESNLYKRGMRDGREGHQVLLDCIKAPWRNNQFLISLIGRLGSGLWGIKKEDR